MVLSSSTFERPSLHEKESVAVGDAADNLVQFDELSLVANRAGNDIGSGMALGIGLIDLTGVDQFLHKAVIARNLLQDAVAQQIGAQSRRPTGRRNARGGR